MKLNVISGELSLESTVQDYTGSYSGVIEGVSATLNIIQKDSFISGELYKGIFIHNLVGVVINNAVRGRLSDPDNFDSYMIFAEFSDGDLHLNLISHHIQKGVTQSDSYILKVINTDTGKSPVNQDKTPGTVDSVNDTQIIGTWARDELFDGSSITVHAKLLIELGEDGNYKILGTKKLEGYKDTGYSGDTTTGRWKTRNKVIYILVSGSKHWKPYAKYQVKNNKLVFVLEDGERQEWTRILKGNE